MHPSLYERLVLSLNKLGISKVEVPQLPSSAPFPPEDGWNQDSRLLRDTLSKATASGTDIFLVTHSY